MAGNIMTASPITDLNSLLMATGASVAVASEGEMNSYFNRDSVQITISRTYVQLK